MRTKVKCSTCKREIQVILKGPNKGKPILHVRKSPSGDRWVPCSGGRRE